MPRTEFISIFYLFDTDGSGGISLDELQAASNQPSP
jgi:Ca2+-binding EF-hand superfamily protein